MSLQHALLGLLTLQPSCGYELTKAFEDDIGRYAWQAGHTSIYPELNRLAGAGLVEVTHEGARGSRTYAATPEGRAELRRWLMEPPPQAKVRNEMVLRLFLISALDRDDALELLRGIADQTAESATELRRIRAENGPPTIGSPVGFGLLAAEFGLRQYEAVHGWAQWAIEQISAADQPAAAADSAPSAR
ncbi:PadR family transcriptional regulator [Pseudonocardia sp. TRM90224]|uniref:PadR family transcriptional regulator n=1 Tax=Pseudonocardia sp. TRM90224 TaxID=2812678 RepID=UPI001E47A376|nr:PadR family transcriptional regulator [Pseudonocardia sp. TRM90224]